MRDQRAERVAVGVLVGDEQEALARRISSRTCASVDAWRSRSCSRVGPRPGRRPRSAAPAAARAPRCRRRRTCSVGVRFRRSSAATRRCRKPCADCSPSRLASRSASSPRTLTYTRAWRRSGLVLTSVTVTNPMRGSLRSCGTASLRTSRTASSTRRMRPASSYPSEVVEGCELGARRGRPAETARPASARRGRRPPASACMRAAVSAAASVARCQRSWWSTSDDRDAEAAVELRLDRRQLLALGLEAPGVGEVQVDQQQGDVGAHGSTAAARRARARPGGSRRPPGRRPP